MTCGAVNALLTMAAAVALRTPRIGSRRTPTGTGPAGGAPAASMSASPTSASPMSAAPGSAAAARAAAAGATSASGAAAGSAAGSVVVLACASTSSLVITPPGPVAVTSRRSTRRSLASLRTGGLASGTGPAPRVPPAGPMSTARPALPFAARS